MGIGSALMTSFGVTSAVNVGGFLITAATRSHKITDLLGTAAFITSASVVSLSSEPHSLRQLILWGAVGLWSARLGGYLFYRVCKLGEDKRLRAFFPKPGSNEGWLDRKFSFFPVKLAGFWTIQSLWAFLSMIPTTIALAAPVGAGHTLFSTANFAVDSVATGLLVGGLLLEWTADYQKFKFKSTLGNENQFMRTGVFRWCRYPNYAGEIAFWFGMWALALPVIAPNSAQLLSLGSPLFVAFLIHNVSGINLLERSNDKKYGSEAAYQAYKRRTNVIVPWPFRNPTKDD